MPVFERKVASQDELVTGSDAATRALSVTAVENDFVEGVYDKLAKVYDITFGPTLHPGRLQAIERMDIQPGERVLEVGVGTGINLSLYPKNCSVVGIDFSGSMLEIAREMRRVCRPGGRIILLNHFLSPNAILSRIARLLSPFTIHIGFKADLDLPAFLAQAEMQPQSIEKVNIPKIWSLVTVQK